MERANEILKNKLKIDIDNMENKDSKVINVSIKIRDPYLLDDYMKVLKQIEKEYDCTLNLVNIELNDW